MLPHQVCIKTFPAHRPSIFPALCMLSLGCYKNSWVTDSTGSWHCTAYRQAALSISITNMLLQKSSSFVSSSCFQNNRVFLRGGNAYSYTVQTFSWLFWVLRQNLQQVAPYQEKPHNTPFHYLIYSHGLQLKCMLLHKCSSLVTSSFFKTAGLPAPCMGPRCSTFKLSACAQQAMKSFPRISSQRMI